jgi:hypothetical protein
MVGTRGTGQDNPSREPPGRVTIGSAGREDTDGRDPAWGARPSAMASLQGPTLSLRSVGGSGVLYFFSFSALRSRSSSPPHMKNACSGTWS